MARHPPDIPVPSRVAALRRSMQLIATAAPSDLWGLALVKLVHGSGPAVLLLLGRNVIARTAALASGGAGDAVPALLSDPVLLWCVLGFVLVHLLLDSAQTLGIFQVTSLRDGVEGTIKSSLYG
jgi:hypothetical protein